MAENAPFFVDREVIVLSREGVWLADGIEITHEPTRRLFARSLFRISTGKATGFELRIGHERKTIQVEDTAYFVVRADEVGDELLLTLNTEAQEPLDPSTLRYSRSRLSCRLRCGEEAKFLRAPYHELLARAEPRPEGGGYSLRVGKSLITLVDP